MMLKDEMYTVIDMTDGYKLRLHPDYIIYRAHFPGRPITPGVCQLQIIQELLECKFNHKLSLSEVVNVKYLAPISPVETPYIIVRFSSLKDYHAIGSIVSEDRRILTKFSLLFKYSYE